MRWRLDDNERGAFNYLLGGLALVLVAKGVSVGLDLWSAPTSAELEVLVPFRQGYLLHDPFLVVSTGTGRAGRIAAALVWSVVAALAAGTVTAGITLLTGKLRKTIVLVVGRTALVLALGWGLYTALFVPVCTVRTTEAGIRVREHVRAVGDIPLPFGTREHTVPFDSVQSVTVERVSSRTGCESTLEIQAHLTDGRSRTLARQQGPCPLTLERLRTASDAAALLERAL